MAQVVVGHKQASRTVTMEIPRSLFQQANSGYNHAAETRVLMMFKDEYKRVHKRGLGFLNSGELSMTETSESQARPQGCGCECPGCDQGHHCRKEDRDC